MLGAHGGILLKSEFIKIVECHSWHFAKEVSESNF